jgi:SNF2 family DNA or RNA helicase
MKIKLNEDQQKAFEIIKDKRHYGIFFDMGVGKTALMLKLIDYLTFERLETNNILILAPATVANKLEVWQEEIKKWDNFSYFEYFNLSGTEKQRIKKLNNEKGSITIMSDSLLNWWYEIYGNLEMFDMIIIDESSRFKSPKTIKFKNLAKMINLEKHRVYLLSGTPAPNGWEDIWSQIYLLDKGERLGSSFWKFLDKYFLIYGYRRYLTKANKIIIENLIKDICIFASSKNIKLPPKEEFKIMLNFPPEKKQQFDRFANDYILELENEEKISVMSKQALINKCLQLANGSAYLKQNRYSDDLKYIIFDDTKLKWVKEYSKTHPKENILVFYCFAFDKERLLELEGAEAIIDIKSKNKWNRGEIKLGIISPFSFQYGGNLQEGGATIIWFGLMWGLENYLQSNKRIYRQGQKNKVKIFYILMENTWDNYVYKIVITKEENQKDFLERINIDGI